MDLCRIGDTYLNLDQIVSVEPLPLEPGAYLADREPPHISAMLSTATLFRSPEEVALICREFHGEEAKALLWALDMVVASGHRDLLRNYRLAVRNGLVAKGGD